MRIVVAGTGRLGAAILEPLLAGPHQVVGLLLNGRRTKGAFRRFRKTSAVFGVPDDPVRIAVRFGVPTLWLDGFTAAALAPIAARKPDLLITCGFGIILKQPLLALPSVGCINVHSSLLPKHRGPMPFNWVVLEGDEQTGVTFHATTDVVDGGAILDQHALAIAERDTAMTVYRRCCDVARHRVQKVVDAIAREGLQGTPQDERLASYDPPLTTDDLRIDWSRPAHDIDRVVRAGTPYLSANFTYRERVIDVERVFPIDTPVDATPGTIIGTDPHLTVATGSGAIAIVRASIGRPLFWPWPNALSRPRIGARLE